ncbi:hypothetical protein HPB49_001045 [Dermacentor silvarum]|uniref:Uncharacterized protein n=1 Tax=Dermacentor silvarum TaxID=543639 RepID=A0ACB8DLS3_DERSI|nr:hypothetical protein HPB49_001045 [Dermacentor silvarum]
MTRYQATVNNSAYLANHYPYERRELMVTGWATRLASSIPRLPEAQALVKAIGAAKSQDGRRQSFSGIPEDQLYFLVTCFMRCSSAGRVLQMQRDQFTLDEDLQRSRDHSVHPCDDFYRHVCDRWDRDHSQSYRSPLNKYEALFDGHVIKRLLLRKIPKYPQKAQDKASALLLKCLSQRGGQSSWTLPKLLLELGLPWPQKSPASRPQLLGTLVKSSLHFGIHMFWAFFVGRHPSRPNQNVIYTTLDERFIDWISNFERLIAYGQHHAYLRRCAEIVGGTGQSYSSMIYAVTTTHFDVTRQVTRLWNPVGLPAFLDLSDPELRRALNGHLADDSQLWPEDKIVNLQPRLFAELNATHFSHSNFTENFKLFLGAYVVWLLSPYASRYLTTYMLKDMGLAAFERSYRHHKCMQALEVTIPLVKWKIEHGSQRDKLYSWKLLRLTVLSVHELDVVYGDAFKTYFSDATSRIALNAWNMTLTWGMLDSAYAYVPFDSQAGFFDLYIRICVRSMSILKKSLRQASLTVVHTPGFATFRLYLMLVAREVAVRNFLRMPPLLDPRHPVPVHAALVGTAICKDLVVLGRFILFYNEKFEHDPTHPIFRQLALLFKDIQQYEAMINRSGFPAYQSLRSWKEVTAAGFAARIASGIPRLPEAQTFVSPEERATSADRRPTFRGIPEDQLYFLVSCFVECGGSDDSKVWGTISYAALGPIHLVTGRITSDDYMDILQYTLVPYVREGPFPDGLFWLQQNGASVHSARRVKELLDNLGI